MDVKSSLQAVIQDALHKAIEKGQLPAGEYPEILLEEPPNKEFGDFSSNIAMQSAKVARKAPRMIGEAIATEIEEPWIEKVEIAGAGFLNFYVKSDLIYGTLATILGAEGTYGNHSLREEDSVLVEYVSANPTGLLHVGHGRGAAYGSAVVNLMKAAGYKVDAEYYINDAGNQIDNLGKSINARYLELLDLPNTFPEDGYRGPDIIKTAQDLINFRGDMYAVMEDDMRISFFKEFGLSEKLNSLRKTLRDFRVVFDRWYSERTLHRSGQIEAEAHLLEDMGYGYRSEDGALWLKTTDFGDDKDRVVLRDNGVPTYFAADIAYHHEKYLRGYKQIIDIWGADHHGYIARVHAAMQMLGHNPKKLEILLMQMVALFRDGESVKMSKRAGTAVPLQELIDEVGIDATRYFFLMRSPDSQLDFDVELAKKKSAENPVYYIQYAHARIFSIKKQLEEAGISVRPWEEIDFSVLQEEGEIDLIKKLSAYEELIEKAARQRAPHRIATYLYELASEFHSLYKQARIMGVSEEVQQARIGLFTAVRYVLAHGLSILGISAPEHM